MKVFLLAITDNAQQHYLLAKAMRDHLGWNAKSMVYKETYLGYKTDWKMDSKDDMEEAKQFIEDTDLFILQDALLWQPGLDLRKYCGHHNTIINGTGSRMRSRIQETRALQEDGWAVVPMLCDSTLASQIASPPFENWIVPVEKIEELTAGIERNKKFSVCHAPTNMAHKGTDRIEAALRPLCESGEIEYERINGVSWEESIRRKAKHNMIIDSLGDTHYNAGNSLEGLAMGQIVATRIDGWCRSLHKDNPIWGLSRNETDEEIRETVRWAKRMKLPNEDGISPGRRRMWVTEHFSSINQIGRWKNYIDWVMNR